MTERGVPDIMGEADGFHQVFIGAKRAGNRTPNLRDLNGVGQAGAVIVSFVIDEDLRLVFQTAEAVVWMTLSRSRWKLVR